MGLDQYVILLNNKVSAVYAYNFTNHQWISYENEKSVAAKAQYANKNNLAGLMMWNIKRNLPADNSKSLLHNAYINLHLLKSCF